MNSMIGRKRILLFGESANIRLSEKTFSTKHHDLQDKDIFHKQDPTNSSLVTGQLSTDKY